MNHRMLHLLLLLATAAMPALAPAQSATKARAIPGTTSLVYTEFEDGNASKAATADGGKTKGSGGIIGAITEVQNRIESSRSDGGTGGTGSSTPDALLKLTATPKLVRDEKSGESSITLDVREDSWKVGTFAPARKAVLQRDRQTALAELGKHRIKVTPEQLARLERGELVEFTITKPFEYLSLLKAGELKVAFGQPAQPKVIHIAVKPVTASQLIAGAAAYVEVTYEPPNPEPACRVTLGAGAGTLTVEATNTGNNRIFRSKSFLPWQTNFPPPVELEIDTRYYPDIGLKRLREENPNLPAIGGADTLGRLRLDFDWKDDDLHPFISTPFLDTYAMPERLKELHRLGPLFSNPDDVMVRLNSSGSNPQPTPGR